MNFKIFILMTGITAQSWSRRLQTIIEHNQQVDYPPQSHSQPQYEIVGNNLASLPSGHSISRGSRRHVGHGRIRLVSEKLDTICYKMAALESNMEDLRSEYNNKWHEIQREVESKDHQMANYKNEMNERIEGFNKEIEYVSTDVKKQTKNLYNLIVQVASELSNPFISN